MTFQGQRKAYQIFFVVLNSFCAFRPQLLNVCHPATIPGLHPVDHHSFRPEGHHIHHHLPLERTPLCLQDPDDHIQSVQQALTCHRAGAVAGQRYFKLAKPRVQSTFLLHIVCALCEFYRPLSPGGPGYCR